MARKFSKKTTKRTRVKLSPKDADEIVRQEFTSSKGDKVINKIRFKPQSPLEPDFKQTIEYKDNEQ